MTRIATIVVLALGLFGAGWYAGRSDNASRIAWLEDEIEQQRELSRQSSIDQQVRNEQVVRLTEQVAAYETELANDPTNGCAADPVYSERLRNILKAAD